MIIFYSGYGCPRRSDPEVVWGAKANVMLTYFDSHGCKKTNLRFRRLCKKRQRRRQRGVT